MAHTESWHLSKSVPVSIIVGFLCQFAGAVWMFSKMDADISNNIGGLDGLLSFIS